MNSRLNTDDQLSIEELNKQIQISAEQASLHLKRTYELKYRLNERVPSGRLTEHVLQFIFTLLAHDFVRLVDGWDPITVCHVCHRWRRIATDTKEFWSNVIVLHVSKERVDRYLALSRNANITVTIKENDFFAQNLQAVHAMLGIIFQHCERITELKILGFAGLVWSHFFPVVESLVTNKLRTLDIRLNSGRPQGVVNSLFRTSQIAPKQPFSQKLLSSTSLGSVHLSGLTLQALLVYDLQVLENLTELSFEDCTFHFSTLPELLQKCPNLEILSLVECRTPDAVWPTHNVNLPCLKDLRLQGMELGEIFQHLQYLNLPETSNWSIECNPDWTPIDIFLREELLLLLGRPLICESLDIGIFFNEVYIQFISSSKCSEENLKKRVKTSLLLHWEGVEPMAATLLRVINLIHRSNWKSASRVQIRVDVDEDEEISEEMWVNLLAPLQYLTFLAVGFLGDSSRTEEEFLRALRRRNTTSTTDSFLGPVMLCPFLDRLSLRYAKFSLDFDLELEHTLRYRRGYNSPIKQLWLIDLTGVEKGLCVGHELKHLVDQLHWNIDDTNEVVMENEVYGVHNDTPTIVNPFMLYLHTGERNAGDSSWTYDSDASAEFTDSISGDTSGSDISDTSSVTSL